MPITYRRGAPSDSPQTFEVFRRSIMDLGQRSNTMPISGGRDPQVLQDLWARRQPLFEHLARTSDCFWVAEDGAEVIGFARSILRDRVRQLTEFFVLPERQAAGLGRELLARAFPPEGASHRFILGTTDPRAVRRYLKAGVYPLFPCYAFSRPAERVPVQSDVTFERIAPSAQAMAELIRLDGKVLGFHREAEHAWLLETRRGYFYRRGPDCVGYGYLGDHNGPFALVDAADFPAILAHAETEAAQRGSEFSVEVPLVNRSAVDYLLRRNCKLDSFFEFFMADALFGEFENYILTSPPFFV